ncbi:phage antirepressor [Rhodococcus sp. Leaf233]|uniref:phage antirepressor n=1 Tax=Rhodococcus sp. Leaf233 TaxID=1736302 RepID=UPI0007102874|nr:phage antirepressor KilAC domain-containing protein [Rhodococcus sp. Leaf233]KQU33526.1 hypothetical protein ASH04_06725 [Rhodococcus sp. Leaf233]
MTDLTPFDNGEFRLDITPHESDGFRVIASGLARALGMRDATRLMESIPQSEKGYTLASTPGGEQRVGYLTESGFYRALGMRQTARIQDSAIRDQVERFQAWVYGVVLPGVRTGTIAAPALTEDEIVHQALQIQSRKVKELEATVADMTPKVDAYERFIDGDGTYAIGAAAKILGRSQNRLFADLRNAGVLIPKGSMRNTPYQRYMHHFEVKAHDFERSDGTHGTSYTTRVQPSGLAFIARKLGLDAVMQLEATA